MSDDDGQLVAKREEFLQTFFRRGAELMDELIRDNTRLRARISQLEGAHRDAVVSRQEYEARAEKVEEGYSTLATLHVATDQLHAATTAKEVLRTTVDILVNFLGAEAFAIWLMDEPTRTLHVAAAEGLPRELLPPVPPGEGILGEVAAGGPPVLGTPVRGLTQIPHSPPVALPLKHGERIVGALGIWTLLAHKPELSDGDRELLHLIGIHAGAALEAARLAADQPSGVPFSEYARLL